MFRSTADAYKAVNRLDDAKVAPDHVSLIAGDAQLAADVGGRSFAIAGTLGGMALGIVLAVFFIFGPGGSGWSNPVGLVIGSVFVAGGLGFIGFVVGQALVMRTSHQNDYEHAVEEGGAVVAVSCRVDECDRARAQPETRTSALSLAVLGSTRRRPFGAFKIRCSVEEQVAQS